MSTSGPTHVEDEDLKLFVRGRLAKDKTVLVWSHLSECETCFSRLDGAVEVARQLAALGQRQQQPAQPQEKRREPRLPANEVASVHSFHPLVLDKSEIRVLDISKNGLMFRSSKLLQVGIVVRIRLKDSFLLGEVRYCTPVGDVFHVGVKIQDSQSSSGGGS